MTARLSATAATASARAPVGGAAAVTGPQPHPGIAPGHADDVVRLHRAGTDDHRGCAHACHGTPATRRRCRSPGRAVSGMRDCPGYRTRPRVRLVESSRRVRPGAPAARQALTVLQALARAPGPVPAAALARDLRLPRSTTYALLAELTEAGFVLHLPEERRYGLGVSAFEIGTAYLRQEPLARLARPVLARLGQTVGQ